jgi:hypothetical protein
MNEGLKKKEYAHDSSHLREGVLEKIAAGSVQPRPRWYFFVRNATLWFSGGVLLLVGSVSVSVIIYLVRGHVWEMRELFGLSGPRFFLSIFPFLWLFAYILFLGVAEVVIRKTRGTYRYSPLVISLVIVLLSVIFGFIFYVAKISDGLDDQLGKHAPRVYQTLDQRRNHLMHRPEHGRVMGRIVSVSDVEFVLQEPRGKGHVSVNFSDVPTEKRRYVQVEEKVLCVGTWSKEQEIFQATDIFPPPPKRKRMLRE